MRRLFVASAIALAAVMSAGASAQTLKAVMHSDVKVLDPVWSGAYITRNYGYMVYDTLFAMDEKYQVKPQMVDSYTTSDDGLVWTFKLRDGLEWHDGQPVTAEDCVASLKRWSVRDAMGQKLAKSIQEYKIVDARTFQIVLKEKFGQIIQAISLLELKPEPTDEDIDEVMSGNLCRCGTYERIRIAVHAAAEKIGAR